MEEEGLPGLRFQHTTPKANSEAASPFPPRAGEPPKFNIQGGSWCQVPPALYLLSQQVSPKKTKEIYNLKLQKFAL